MHVLIRKDTGHVIGNNYSELSKELPDLYVCLEVEEIEGDYNNYVINETGDGVEYSEERFQENISVKMAEIKKIRNRILSESDWAMMSDNGLDEDTKQKWVAYRQELREWPKKHDFNLIWSADIPKPP